MIYVSFHSLDCITNNKQTSIKIVPTAFNTKLSHKNKNLTWTIVPIACNTKLFTKTFFTSLTCLCTHFINIHAYNLAETCLVIHASSECFIYKVIQLHDCIISCDAWQSVCSTCLSYSSLNTTSLGKSEQKVLQTTIKNFSQIWIK